VTRTPADPSNHGWTEESKNASCTSDGFVSKECQISRNLREKGLPNTPEHTYYEVIPAYGHNIRVDFERLAAHGVDGYKKESCVNCGEVWEYYTAGEAHTYVPEAEICCALTSPEVSFVCTVCGDVQIRTVEIPAHVFESVSRTEPDCTTDGEEQLVCTACSFEKAEVLPALGHDFGEAIGEVDCSFDKTDVTYTCARCGESVTEKITVPPHDFVLKEKNEPSCTEEGSESYVCSVCTATDVRSIAALGHEFGEGELKREAGYFRSGELAYTCLREGCSEVKTEAIAKKDGSLFAIGAATAGTVAVIAAICLILMKGAKKRIAATADEATKVLESAEATEKTEEELKK